MSEHLHSSSEQSSTNEGLATDALARRRMLLGGLGKGSVVLAAAAAPMHSFASGDDCKTDNRNKYGKHFHAAPSRCGSEVGSRAPNMPIAQGYCREHYLKRENWPIDPKTGKSCADTPAKNVIRTTYEKTCFEYVKDGRSQSTFVTSYANAIKCNNGIHNYPHTCQEIKNMSLGLYSGCTDVAKCKEYLQDLLGTLT